MTPDRIAVTLSGALLIGWILWYFLGSSGARAAGGAGHVHH